MSKNFFEALDSKTSFGFGIASGLGIVFVIGFFVMLGLYFKGDNPGVTTPTAAVPAAVAPVAPTPQPVAVAPQIVADDHVIGAKNAKVTLVEFSDIQCPFCSRFHPTVQQLLDEYPNDLRWVYKHFPLDSLHPQARPAAEATECLATQLGDEKFFDYLDVLFANQQTLSRTLFVKEAVKLGVNESEFTSCLDNGDGADRVSSDYQQGLSSGVTGTPGSFVNNQMVRGALPYEQVKAMVDAELAK